MKTALMICLVAVAGTLNMTAQQTNNDTLQAVKQLVAATEEKMKAQGMDFPEAVAENVSMLRKIPEFKSIENGADAFWESGLKNLATVAPSPIAKIIFVHACQNMAPENYIKFLNEAASQYDQKNISKTVLTVAIYPNGKLECLLSDNYRNKDVINFCQHAQRIWADDPQMVDMFRVILSGEAKKSNDDMRKAGALNVPELKLGSSATPNPPAAAAPPRSQTLSQTPPAASPSATTPVAETPAAPVERKSPVWPWVVGMLALVVIVAVALKRRA